MNQTCRTQAELVALLQRYMESHVHMWLVGFGFTILVVLGVLANVGVVTVFSRKQMRYVAMNIMLRALGISDILFLVFFWMNQVIFPLFHWLAGMHGTAPGQHTSIANVGAYASYPWMKTFYTSSTWLVAVASLERYLAICHPFKQSCLKEPKKANMSIIIIFAAAFLVNIPSFMRFRLVPVENVTVVHPRPEFEDTFSRYYVVLRVLFHFLIPFAILITCNGMTAYAIRKMQKFHQTGISNVMRNEMRTGTMFIAYGVLFIMCQTWPTAHYFLATFAKEWYTYCVSEMNLVLRDLEHFLLILNCMCSLLIYLKYGSKFRTVFLHVFFSRLRPEFKLVEPTSSRSYCMSVVSKASSKKLNRSNLAIEQDAAEGTSESQRAGTSPTCHLLVDTPTAVPRSLSR